MIKKGTVVCKTILKKLNDSNCIIYKIAIDIHTYNKYSTYSIMFNFIMVQKLSLFS